MYPPDILLTLITYQCKNCWCQLVFLVLLERYSSLVLDNMRGFTVPALPFVCTTMLYRAYNQRRITHITSQFIRLHLYIILHIAICKPYNYLRITFHQTTLRVRKPYRHACNWTSHYPHMMFMYYDWTCRVLSQAKVHINSVAMCKRGYKKFIMVYEKLKPETQWKEGKMVEN